MVIIAVHEDGSILRVIRPENEEESTKAMLRQYGYRFFVVHETSEPSRLVEADSPSGVSG